MSKSESNPKTTAKVEDDDEPDEWYGTATQYSPDSRADGNPAGIKEFSVQAARV